MFGDESIAGSALRLRTPDAASAFASSLGRGLISIQHAIDERAKRRLRMATIRIVEEEAGTRERPACQHAPEPSARDRLADAIVVVGVENAESLQRPFDDDILVIRDQRAFHRYLELLSLRRELPAIDPPGTGKAPVDAGMVVQIRRRLRLAVACEVGG